MTDRSAPCRARTDARHCGGSCRCRQRRGRPAHRLRSSAARPRPALTDAGARPLAGSPDRLRACSTRHGSAQPAGAGRSLADAEHRVSADGPLDRLEGQAGPRRHHRDRPDRAVERAGAASGGRLQHRDRLARAHLRAVVDPAEGHGDRGRRDRGDARQELRGGRDRSSGPAAGVRRRTDVRARSSRFAAGGDPDNRPAPVRCAGLADRPLRVLRRGDRGRLGCRVGALLRP